MDEPNQPWRLIAAHVRAFEKELPEGQESRIVVHQNGHQVSMRLSQIVSHENGFLLFCGFDDDDRLLDVGIHFAHLTYTLTAVESKNSRRFGFGTDARTKPPAS